MLRSDSGLQSDGRLRSDSVLRSDGRLRSDTDVIHCVLRLIVVLRASEL